MPGLGTASASSADGECFYFAVVPVSIATRSSLWRPFCRLDNSQPGKMTFRAGAGGAMVG